MKLRSLRTVSCLREVDGAWSASIVAGSSSHCRIGVENRDVIESMTEWLWTECHCENIFARGSQ